MRAEVILRYMGAVILLNAAFMFLSAGVSAAYGFDTGFYPLLLSGLLTAVLGLFPMIFVRRAENLNMKEGYAIVVGSWLVACLVGTFPFLLWGGEFDGATAWFESVSGFTTTGATALTNVESLPKGLLFWRSATHWLGGVGVVMFTLVIVPMIGRTKMTLSSVELSPLARDNYRYRTAKIVRILLILYVGLTLCETLLLKVAGMTWFDAVNHSFSSIATGGFSTRNASIGYYDNKWIEMILILFMTVSGIHFGLTYATLTGKRNNIFRSEVTRYFLLSVLIGGFLIALSLKLGGGYETMGGALRDAYFQTVSYITTTGFATTDTNLWTPFATALLIFFMFQCACAGSTSGGIKSDRVWLAMKVIRARILQQQHPSAVIRIKLNGTAQEDSLVSFAMLFIVVYLLIVLAGTLVISATGMDLMSSFSMSASCMGNIGPGFGTVGTASDYSAVAPGLKIFSTLLMLLGRLEIFGLIQLFLLKWWK